MHKPSLFLKHISERSEQFKTNSKLNDLISNLKFFLEPIQIEKNRQHTKPSYPVVLVLGSPRSGTTILTQILANSGGFAYPSNFLSRFAYSPFIGALIQEMLFNPNYDFRGELSDIQSSSTYNSYIGKTDGALGVNEFFHFWRKFFPNYDPEYLSDEELRKVDIQRMRSELASIQEVFEKPFVSKGMMLQYNINYFINKFPEFIFVHIKRDPLFVMQSILMSRRNYYKSDDIWWSVKPKEYSWLKDKNKYSQIAGQVYFTEKNIHEQLDNIEPKNKFVCKYEDLCNDPNKIYESLREIIANNGYYLPKYNVPGKLTNGNTFKLHPQELDSLKSCYESLKAEHETPYR